MRGQQGGLSGSDWGQAGSPARSTWLSSSGESFRLLTEAAFRITCLASSVLPRASSHRADSGRTLQVRSGCGCAVLEPPQAPGAVWLSRSTLSPTARAGPLSRVRL